MAEWRAQGSELGSAYFLTLLAGALGRQGNFTEALAALGEAQAFADRTHEHYWLAERHRVEGELLLLQNEAHAGAAEALFRQALDLAGRQQARSVELRAALSLVRLQLRQDRADEGRARLRAIMAQFTEGFDARDFVEARALLGEPAPR